MPQSVNVNIHIYIYTYIECRDAGTVCQNGMPVKMMLGQTGVSEPCGKLLQMFEKQPKRVPPGLGTHAGP